MDYTDLASLSPHKSGGDSGKSSSTKKRGMANNGSRLRLLPIDGASYEVGSGAPNSNQYISNNNGNNNGNNSGGSGSSSSSMTSTMMGKLKKITQKRELLEAVRKANAPIILPLREQPGTHSTPISGSGAGTAGVREGAAVSLRRDSSSMSLGAAGGEEDGATQAARDIECLEDGVRSNARKYNDHKMLADRKQRELETLLDELRTLHLETQALRSLQNQETPIAKQSQRIRDDIQACTASMEEQMHVRRQLDHMMRRLQNGQLKIDSHLEAMAKTVEASHREGDEVKLLCRQLEAGKSRAIQFLQDVQQQVQVDRKTRARELNDTEIRAKNAQKMESWRLERMQERAEMVAELRGDMSADDEQRLLRCIESRERANDALHVANLTKSQKAADYEEVLSQLKVAMGASSLQEVVDKIHAQTMTSVSLDKEKSQGEGKLITVRQEKEHALQSLNELKASGIGGMELNREVYNTLESEIQQAKATLKVNKAAYERLDGVIQGVRQGSSGLAQRLQVFDDVLDLSGMDAAGAGGATTGTTTTANGNNNSIALSLSPLRMDNADCLALAELKLTKILELVGQQSSSSNGFPGGNGGGSGGPGAGGFGGASSGSTTGNGSGSGDDDENSGFDDLASSRGVEFLDDRHAIWSPTANTDPVLHKNNIRVPAGRHGSPFFMDMDDEAEDELLRLAAIDSARSDASTSSETGVHVMDVHVPSRDILKMSSSRHFAEVMRKKEMAEKQKAAAERGISDEEMMSKLRKKNQQDANTRLATSPLKAKQSALLGGGGTATSGAAGDPNSIAFVTQLHFNDL